jgi:glycopeptide antibiotics resistance protein
MIEGQKLKEGQPSFSNQEYFKVLDSIVTTGTAISGTASGYMVGIFQCIMRRFDNFMKLDQDRMDDFIFAVCGAWFGAIMFTFALKTALKPANDNLYGTATIILIGVAGIVAGYFIGYTACVGFGL